MKTAVLRGLGKGKWAGGRRAHPGWLLPLPRDHILPWHRAGGTSQLRGFPGAAASAPRGTCCCSGLQPRLLWLGLALLLLSPVPGRPGPLLGGGSAALAALRASPVWGASLGVRALRWLGQWDSWGASAVDASVVGISVLC